MSKLTGNQGFNGDVYIKGVGDYTGNNPDSSSPLHEVIQSLLNKINAFTSHGVSSIVALTESEYAALTTKDATTLYIVKPDTNFIKLTGSNYEFYTIDEVGAGWDVSDLANNPPILYIGTEQQPTLRWESSGSTIIAHVASGSFQFTPATLPTSVSFVGGGGSE